MTSERQIAANRANALHSTGPKTPEGKAAVRQNALRHGLLAGDVVLPEQPVELAAPSRIQLGEVARAQRGRERDAADELRMCGGVRLLRVQDDAARDEQDRAAGDEQAEDDRQAEMKREPPLPEIGHSAIIRMPGWTSGAFSFPSVTVGAGSVGGRPAKA